MLNAMIAKEVTKKILNNEPLFILDVRNEDAFADWKIEGASVKHKNIPYFDLMEGVEEILGDIPEEDVLVVCAKEGSSVFVGEMLVEAGVKNVSYLKGGMKAWSEYLEPVKVADLADGGTLYQFVRIGKGCLSYLVESDGEAMIIDSTRMVDQYVSFIEEKGWKLVHVADTHLHADHISGGPMLREATDATYWLPPKDAEEVTFAYEKLEDGVEITVGSTKVAVQAIYSPGHTIGSTSFVVDNRFLLSGDILFVESIGRPDLAGKAEDWVADLRETLYARYKELSKELVVLPAHFGNMTEVSEGGLVAAHLGDLFQNNAGLNIEDEEEFRKLVSENLPPQPNAYQQIREMNMGKINPSDEEQRDMEIGPNRCAVHG
jgi:glyoxylase-like metal-dependent hydrolase (beta-lactamase superfamily II)